MVANYIYYRARCMNAFKASRIHTGRSVQHNMYGVALDRLVEQLEVFLFHLPREVWLPDKVSTGSVQSNSHGTKS